jgi:cytochrome c6
MGPRGRANKIQLLAAALSIAVIRASDNGSVAATPDVDPAANARSDAALVDAGKSLYKGHCAQCHGPNMVTPGIVAFDLRKFPADQPDRFADSVRNGKGAMPAWKDVLTDAQISALFAYVLTGGK